MKRRQNQSEGGKNANILWSASMDDALIDALCLQQTIGNRVNGTFTTTAYDNIVKEVNEKVNMALTKDHVKNRMKTLKSNFSKSYDIFKNGLSGFSIDPVTNMWTAEDEVWKALIEANPDAEKWRMTSLPHNYDKLVMLFGHDRATGEGSLTAKERLRRMSSSNLVNESYGDTIQQIDEMVSQNQILLEPFVNITDDCDVHEVDPTPHSSSKRIKKKPRIEEDINIKFMKEFMESVGTAIKANSVACTESLLSLTDKSQSSNSMKDLYTELEGIGLEKELRMKAYKFLVKDDRMHDAFFGLPSLERKEFLLDVMRDAGII